MRFTKSIYGNEAEAIVKAIGREIMLANQTHLTAILGLRTVDGRDIVDITITDGVLE